MLTLLAAVMLAPKLSESKLSIHLLGGRYTEGARSVVATGPRVLKIFDLHKDMLDAVRDYKSRFPNGTTIVRLWTPVKYAIADDPEKSADDYWNRHLWPPLAKLEPKDRSLLDFVEGPNEGDSTPTWFSDEQAKWFTTFWVRLITHYQENGIRPCVGSVAVGQPPGTDEEMERRWRTFVPALVAASEARGAWSYHAYTVAYGTDAKTESYYSLRYRRLRSIAMRARRDVGDLPLILSEGGVDQSGNPETSGWMARGTPLQYQDWLRWFDRELGKDKYVLGVTLFQIGDPKGWPSFDLEIMAPWLAEHIRRKPSRRY